MNTNSKIKKLAAYAAAIALTLTPMCKAHAESDDFGIWSSIEAKKKLTDKLSFSIEGELRTISGVQEIDRRALGLSMSYKVLDWLKADLGYIYIQSFNATEKKLKEIAGPDADGNELWNYNVDHSYWEERDRFYAQLTASWKIGRIKFSLRERLQYQYTHSALIYEDKYRYELTDINDPNAYFTPKDEFPESSPEIKDSKHNTVLRSRLTAKWDIRKCKIEPFASVELFTRTDEWRGHDKLRYRIGADYKIDKKNDITLYYMFQENHSSDNPAGHAIGIGYTFEL